MKVDMSPEAITRRLQQTSQLRDLCLALAAGRKLSETGRVTTTSSAPSSSDANISPDSNADGRSN